MTLNPTTLLFELINFLLLLWLLSKLLYAPLRRAIEGREQELARQREEIEQALQAARAREAEWTRKNAQLLELADQVRSDALQDAIAEKGRMLTQAREEAAAERAKVEKLLEAERRDAREWVRSMAVEESTVLAGRLLQSLAQDLLEDALARALCDEIEKRAPELAGAQREASPEVEIAGARFPPEETVSRLREALATALGEPARLSLREDPELIAGLSLRIGDQVLDASIAGQLDAFRLRARELLEANSDG